jgi:hypothetical protein
MWTIQVRNYLNINIWANHYCWLIQNIEFLLQALLEDIRRQGSHITLEGIRAIHEVTLSFGH